MKCEHTIPAWLPDFLGVYSRPEQPSLKAALAEHRASLSKGERAPELWEVKRALNDLASLFGGANV